MFRTFSIATRIYGLFTATALFLCGVIAAFYLTVHSVTAAGVEAAKGNMLEEERAQIKAITHSTAQALGALAAGLPGDEAKLDLIARAVEKTRFGADSSGYFFVYTGTVNAAHPTQKQLIGKDLGQTKDSNGVLYVRELHEAASKGGDFVSFVFDKPGKGLQPKLGYAEMVPGTPYWIGTGVYIDNIAAAEAAISQKLGSMANTRVAITLGVAAVLLLLLVLPVSLAISRSIVRPLREVMDSARCIAGGSLDACVEIHGQDEITELQKDLAAMVQTLQANLQAIKAKEAEAAAQAGEARQAAERADELAREALAAQERMLAAARELEGVVRELGQAGTGLAGLSQNITRGADDQTSRVAETATAMNQMNATVLEVARNAGLAAEQTEASRAKAREGEEAARSTVESMRRLRAISETLRGDMQRLGAQSEAIGAVMNVINDIADQTNLLALNAAIEAARAGDAGRGFAVVADEVRKLAEKTMNATREVGQTIQGIQGLTRANVDSMDGAMRAMDEAEQRSAESGGKLQDILTMAERAAGQVASIAAAAEQQSAASEQITRSLDRIDAVAKNNSDLAADASRAIQGVVGQTDSLRRLIREFEHRA